MQFCGFLYFLAFRLTSNVRLFAIIHNCFFLFRDQQQQPAAQQQQQPGPQGEANNNNGEDQAQEAAEAEEAAAQPVPPPPPQFLDVVFTFLSTFFTSIIPEQIQPHHL